MKNISIILFALILLAGCENSDEILNPNENFTYELIKLPKRSVTWTDSAFSLSQEIDGSVGGVMVMEKYYISEDGDSVFVEAELTIPKGAFQGVRTISMTLDTQDATIHFYPEMIFDNELKFSQYFRGLNLDNYSTGTIDFYYITDDGSVELIKKNGVQVILPQGLLRVLNAKLHHFSRYGWIRKSSSSS